MALRFPPVSQFLERFRALLSRRRRFDFDAEVAGLSRVEQAVALLALLELRKSGEIALSQALPFAPIRVSRALPADDERIPHGQPAPPDRLEPGRPPRAHDRGAPRRRVVAPLSSRSSREAADDDAERIETALGLLGERYARDGAGSCSSRSRAATRSGRRGTRPTRARGSSSARSSEGLSQAALETLAIVAYLGPCSRPEIARIRGVAADSAVASLVERGLITEAGRESGLGGAIRYRTTPLFERVFGLESLAALPRLDDLGEDAEELRARSLEVASARAS